MIWYWFFAVIYEANASPKHTQMHHQKPSQQKALTSDSYRRQVANITDCATFNRATWDIDEATPLLKRLFSNPIPEKSEFETTEAYAARLYKSLILRVGDPFRIYTIVAIPSPYLRYDADTGIMTIKYPDYTPDFKTSLDEFNEHNAEFMGSNAFGVRKMITSYTLTELRADFRFVKDSMPWGLTIKMTPEEASYFKTNRAWLHVLSAINGYSTDMVEKTATIERPKEQTTYYQDVTLVVRCAVMSKASILIPGWT